MADIYHVRKIIAETADGKRLEWVGTEGFVSIMTLAARPPGAGPGAMAKPFARQVQANLTVPLVEEVTIVGEEEADSGVPL